MATLESKLIVSLRDAVSGPARGVSAALARLRRQGERTSGVLLGGGKSMIGANLRGLLAVGAGYYGVTKAIGGTVGAAIKFEEAFSDVKKVFSGTPAQLEQVRSQILDLSKHLPNSAEGLSDIFAAAAQSNIPFQELGKFSEMVAKVAVAWDVTEGETSDALAKIKNQLHMGVDEIGLYADAINYLSNNTAAKAPDLVDFSKRVAANGEMFGFTAEQTLAFGGAMVAMGAQTEVAATSFRNMGRSLTIGARATKMQRTAFSKLGLDSVKTAKSMQKNAYKTTLDVLDRIQKLPEWERISIASALFGDEARALMPVINKTDELRRQADMLANSMNYAGSATKEFEERAATTGNALKLLKNRISAIGIEMGSGWTSTIKAAADGIGDVLLTLKQRVGILDDIKAAFEGFMGGLGGVAKDGQAGGIRKMMNDLGDAVFGEAFTGGSKQVDERVTALAKLSNRMRGIGADFRQFFTDISAGDFAASFKSLKSAVSEMSGAMTVGGAIAIGLTGAAMIKLGEGALALTFSKAGQIAIMAMAVASLIDAVKGAESLGEFVESLKGLDTIEWVAIGAGLLMIGTRAMRAVKWFKELANNAPKAPGGTPAGQPGTTTPVAAGGGGLLNALGLSAITAFWASLVQGLGDTPGSTFEEQVANQKKAREQLRRVLGLDSGEEMPQSRGGPLRRGRDRGDVERERSLDEYLGPPDRPNTPNSERKNGQSPSPAGDGSPLLEMMRWFWGRIPTDLTKPIGEVGRGEKGTAPRLPAEGPNEVSLLGTPPVTIAGTPSVALTNPPPRPNISIHAPITVNGITDLDMIGRHLQNKVSEAMSGIQSDVEYSPGL